MKTKLPRFGAAIATFAMLTMFAAGCANDETDLLYTPVNTTEGSPQDPGADLVDFGEIYLFQVDSLEFYDSTGLLPAPYLFTNTSRLYHCGTHIDGDGNWSVAGTATAVGFNVGSGQTNSITVPNGVPIGVCVIQCLTATNVCHKTFGDTWSARASATGTATQLRYVQRVDATGQPVTPQGLTDTTRTTATMPLVAYTNESGQASVAEFTGSDGGTNFQGTVYKADVTFPASITMPITCNLLTESFDPLTATYSNVTVANGSGVVHLGLIQNGFNSQVECHTTKTTFPGYGTQIPVQMFVNLRNASTSVLIGVEPATYYFDTLVGAGIAPTALFQARATPTALDVIDQAGNNVALVLQRALNPPRLNLAPGLLPDYSSIPSDLNADGKWDRS